ncbi:cilia- and flagella-associated protein HOATZ [Menidia menidia]
MSQRTEAPEEGELEQLFTVFDGSCPEDESHARRLWSSVSLLPPLESRLVAADIRQRLPVRRPRPGGTPGGGPELLEVSPDVNPEVTLLRRRREERRRYEAMADQRKEILALLGRQRQQRIRKELLSAGYKPKDEAGRNQVKKAPETDCETEKELVAQLL